MAANDNSARYAEGVDAGWRADRCVSLADYPAAMRMRKSASDPFFMGWAHGLTASAMERATRE